MSVSPCENDALRYFFSTGTNGAMDQYVRI